MRWSSASWPSASSAGSSGEEIIVRRELFRPGTSLLWPIAASDGLLGRCVRLAKGCAPSAVSFATRNSRLLHPAEDSNVRYTEARADQFQGCAALIPLGDLS